MRASPASASETPSVGPSADAGAPNVEVRTLGSSAVGISWPASDNKLAVPMPATSGLSQRAFSSLDSVTAIGESVTQR